MVTVEQPDTTLTAALPRARSPYHAYLAHFDGAESGPTMRGCLARLAGMVRPRPAGMDERQWAELVPWHQIGQATAKQVRSTLAARVQAKAWSASYANKHLAALRGVIYQAWDLGHIDADARDRITRELKGIKGKTLPAGRNIDTSETVRLLEVTAAGGRPADIRDAALIAVFHSTGGRCSEVARLLIEEYDHAGRAGLFKGKGNKEREAYLHPQAAARMDAWLTLLNERRGPVFRRVDRWGNIGVQPLTGAGIRDIIDRRRRAAGLKPLSSHDWRRTLVGDMLEDGEDLVTVQEYVGHADPATTARYDRRPKTRKRAAADRRNLALPLGNDSPNTPSSDATS
jgi:site-specific recombinase XerD